MLRAQVSNRLAALAYWCRWEIDIVDIDLCSAVWRHVDRSVNENLLRRLDIDYRHLLVAALHRGAGGPTGRDLFATQAVESGQDTLRVILIVVDRILNGLRWDVDERVQRMTRAIVNFQRRIFLRSAIATGERGRS